MVVVVLAFAKAQTLKAQEVFHQQLPPITQADAPSKNQ